MKIKNIEAVSLVVPLKDRISAPISIPYANEIEDIVFAEYRTTIVKVETDTGVTGLGECIVRLTPTATRDIIETIKPVLIGRDPRDVETIWELMYAIMMNRGHTKGFYIEAISGIDIALWDAVAKYEGVPISKLLGGIHNDPIKCYASSIRYRGIETSIQEAKNYVSMGYDAMKIKIGKDARRDVELVAAIRDGVGPDVTLMVDANCGYDVHTALQVGKQLESHNVYWFEEPISTDNLDGYHYLANKLNIPLAAGEAEFTRYGFRDLITRGGIGIVQPNVSRAGGFTECRKIAALASAYHVPYAPHTGSTSIICLAASMQLAAHLPGFLIYEFMRSDWNKNQQNPLRHELANEQFEVFENSYLQVLNGPGLGITLNEEVVEKWRV